MTLHRYLVEEIALDHAEGMLSRREALRRLGLMGVGAVAASSFLAACSTNDDEAAPPSTSSPGSSAPPAAPPGLAAAVPSEAITFPGPSAPLQGAWAAASQVRAAMLVVHENRGLTDHIRSVAGRLGGAGYSALAVDLLSREGGTASLNDPGMATAALGNAPPERLVADLRAGVDELGRRAPGAKLGVVGFCFGGAMTWRLLAAGESRLAAAAPFYGPVPENTDFSRARAAVLAVYAERDDRVNATREAAAAALRQAALTHEVRTFAGVDHAFFNDTGPRYDATAAAEAYKALLDWLGRHLS